MSTALTFSQVSKRFGAVQALDDCSFSVGRGRMLGFLGPNGAGKTTAMRAVFDLVRIDGGELLWDGRPIGLAERLRFGYMPEERGLYPRMRVGEQLEYFGCLHGLSAAPRGPPQRSGSTVSGLRTVPAQRSRSSRTGTSSARNSPRRCCTSRSCSSSTSRSLGSTPSRCARSPTCSAARRRGARQSSSRATSSSS